MASPYLVAMEHAEWHASKTLHKRHQKRPLGHLERKYNFTPPQPVLSCRSVAIDLSGTRTYRSRSASDIIAEQHKLIHNVYTKARNIASASAARPQHAAPPTSPQPRAISAIKVEGVRPKTAPAERTDTARKSSPHLLKHRARSRPRTAVSQKEAQKTSEKHAEEILDSARNFQKINRLIYEQWDDCNHDISEGIFVRGRKKEGGASLDPKTGNQWLSFAGSAEEKSKGVVEAFSSMKSHGGYYSIDGSTGSQVARKLQHGDNIRIGRNGHAVSASLHERKPQSREMSSSGDADDNKKAKNDIIPLCWTDQVAQQEVKVIPPSTPRKQTRASSVSETQPVIYRHLDEGEDNESKQHNVRSKSGEGYRVKTKSKGRVSIDGNQRESSTITHLSISRDASDSDDEGLSYEAILQMQLSLSRKENVDHGIEKAKILSGIATKPESVTEELAKMSERSESVSERDFGKGAASLNVGVPGCLSRPTTAFSGTSQESDLEHLVVQAGNSTPLRTGKSQTQRSSSAGRPPPAKPQLHKTTAAGGASINSVSGSNGQSIEVEFIQFARQMHISREQTDTKKKEHQLATPDEVLIRSPSPIINHVPEGQTLNIVCDDPRPLSDLGELEDKPSTPVIPCPPSNTPPHSLSPSPDIHYAFNIPTGQVIQQDIISPGDVLDH